MAKKNPFSPILLTLAALFSVSLFVASKRPTSESPSFTSSKECKECHEEIYNHWKNAMHSMSIEDPIFNASYIQSYFNTAGEAKYNCLHCHAPMTLVNKDYDLKKETTKEGVSCDFCHSIKNVNLENKSNPFEVEIGKTKRGPLSNVNSPAHETQSSSLFKSSKLCAGCHEYTNGNGVKILATYSEWEKSSYAAEGIQCQNCHMPLTNGNIVKSKIKSSGQKQINLHAISASHSTEQLRKALEVRIKDIHKDGDAIEVIVEVVNVGSGHMVPTGISTRQLVLSVELKTPKDYFVKQKIYQRKLADESGKEITKECELFLLAAQDSLDNRIRPKETRKERFAFVMPQNKEITISAKLEYLYKTTILSPTEIRVKMSEDVKSISR